MSYDCTIVVSSCDAYEELWNPFFKILKAEWKDLDYPIVLNTETKDFQYEGLDIKTFHLQKEKEQMSWTKRLKKTLEKIKSEYILFMLDDFFLQGPVDVAKLNQCFQWMNEDERISVFSFMETEARCVDDNRYEGFVKRPLVGKFKFNCQAAIWRRKRLIQYLGVDENPWEWEVIGNWRSYRHPLHLFYVHKKGEKYIFPYLYYANGINWGGLGLYRGRWYLPYVEPLFKKHGIGMDYSIKGTIEEKDLGQRRKKPEEYPSIKRRFLFLIPIVGWLSKIKYIRHFF